MENQYNYYNPEPNQDNFQNNSQSSYTNGEKNSKKKFPKTIAVIGFALLFGVVSSATYLTSNIVGSKILGLDEQSESAGSEKTTAAVNSPTLTKSSSVITSDVSSIVENVMPSVVSITNLSVQQVQSFFGGTFEQESQSAGSGIIISQTDDELLIVTNYHVIENCETLTVTFDDESSVEADVKGTDSSHDLAVIAVPLDKISDDTMDAISIATLGDSTKLKAGEPAIAIGNALGYGQSVTVGVISALNRETTTTNQFTGETESDGVKLIQTDAAINPGNSGGALLNANGEVIGINSSKLASTEVEGMGYAIPISDVSDIIDDLMNQKTKKKVAESDKGYIGIAGWDVIDEDVQKYGVPHGVYVREVIKGGGAEAAGIEVGDVITGLNGTSISGMDELQNELQYYAVGETVSVTIQVPKSGREYVEKTVEVTLGKSS